MFVKVHFYKKAKKYNKNMLTAKFEKFLLVLRLVTDPSSSIGCHKMFSIPKFCLQPG